MPGSFSPEVEAALLNSEMVDITTVGRRSGKPSTVEIWFHRALGRYFITGTPGPRDWLANLTANPKFTFSLKQSIQADLPATARVITDPTERHEILSEIDKTRPWYGEQPGGIEAMYEGAPLFEVIFDELPI
ncbi:MAG: nitroreductase family deazaflavin-dependent oxidoreductase [Chloroflexi bacterium]|nr:nitroreductase family deazaflavin-dependent oxidoreductase [Chloroflexota bacterium]